MTIQDLTARQRQVVELVSEGLSYKQVAARLQISIRTVESVTGKLFDRTGNRGIIPMLREFYDFVPRKK